MKRTVIGRLVAMAVATAALAAAGVAVAAAGAAQGTAPSSAQVVAGDHFILSVANAE
ncbi:hypothetical protein ACIRD3_06315 [Kitasatospora sp. NPDC093550]|uniref:hypothetical protein n=1 Tax=Kitasatospora sp. NPDC093550 TaxID=3364089 RepID=UPI0038226035